MACKLLLISANRHQDPYPVYPLGVSYLKTYLENHMSGCQVEIFDCNRGSNSDLISCIETFRPTYVALSLRNADGANSLANERFIDAYGEIVKAVRSATTAPVIVGGAGFSIFPREFMTFLGADYGIEGEGEQPLHQLLEALEKKEPCNEIAALWIGDRANRAGRSYLDCIEVNFEPHLADYYWKHSGMLNIQTKRGCPHNCIYCSYPVIDGRRVRTMDPDRIIENIKRMKKEFGTNYLFFTDSVFNICNNYNIELAEKLISSGVDISWGAYFSPSNLTDEQMKLYKAAGLTHIEFGTESFSDDALRAYGKNFTFDDVLRVSELSLKHNVYYSHFLILGGYGETQQTLRESMENSKKLRYTVLFPYVGMRIYPHTELSKILVREGFLSADDNLFEPRYYVAEDFDLEQARAMAQETGKAWIFPDDPKSEMMDEIRIKRKKKGPIWEYLRKP